MPEERGDDMTLRLAEHMLDCLDQWWPVHRHHGRYREEGCPWCVIYRRPLPPGEMDAQIRLTGALA